MKNSLIRWRESVYRSVTQDDGNQHCEVVGSSHNETHLEERQENKINRHSDSLKIKNRFHSASDNSVVGTNLNKVFNVDDAAVSDGERRSRGNSERDPSVNIRGVSADRPSGH